MRKQFKKFLKSSWGLEIYYQEKAIFKSKKAGVKGLLDFIKKYDRRYGGVVIFDKIVGRGAALLAVYLRAQAFYGKTGSKLARKILKKSKIKFYFQKTVPSILNKKKTDLCPFEKLSLNKTPKQFYNSLKKQLVQDSF